MATYTVIRNSNEENRSECVLEFPVPGTGTNNAGLQWRTIVAEVRAAEESPTTANPRKLTDAAYLGQLDAGEIVEVAFSVEYDANLTNAEKAALLDAAASAKEAEYSNDFTALYQFYGLERTV